MTSRRQPADAKARAEALDPTRSFIVQAPAGSGKTGLLTQRYLKLLSGVEEPERIVAITFTKKAAAEMRNRILDALRAASAGTPPKDTPHEQRTRELALAALARERALPLDKRWNLLANPQRLRIQTIDSFNAALTRQMPLLTRLGAQPAIVEDARDHHLEAAALALEPHDDLVWGEAVKTLHAHLDGNLGRARELIASMLGSRDQWIWHLAGGAQGLSRDDLEAALDRAVRAELAAVEGALAPSDLQTALDLIQVAASNLAAPRGPDAKPLTEAQTALIRAAELAAGGLAPNGDPDSLPIWLGLSHLLLTGGGELRSPKGVNVGLGFGPDPATKPHKLRLQALLESLAEHDELAGALERVRLLPPTCYSDEHWKVLGAFVEVLRHAFALLERVFQQVGEVDFSEVSLRALRALRDGEMPTDLALALDHRIEHLLVDEFQDTSKNQLYLVERLTEGWAEGDGRTLFVVGDPMQSIYRFRKAEVGLFMQALNQGIGSVRLNPLHLTENFRAQEKLVDWTNQSFAALFPDRADAANGAVPFAAATASHPPLEGDAVTVHPLFDAAPEVEAALVTTLVKEALAAGHASVAILVSARTHLREIMPALKAAGITPRVTDIEPLGSRPMVRDLVALTRALTHAGDRTAWLSVLRAPWCGHTLADLLAEKPAPRVEAVFAAARIQHRRVPLTRLVQGAWLALGGPSCARDAEDLADARAYFEFLAEHDVAGDLDDPAALDELMETLHAPPAPDADPRVQVLTMHKAKGLEFDTVILPGLQRIGRSDDPALLRWLDRPGGDLLMAALAATGADTDPIYKYVGELARQQRAAEQLRQLYVATTRPKQRLHLIGHAVIGKDGVKRPPTGSLLRAMWEVVAGEFEDAASASTSNPLSHSMGEGRGEGLLPFRRLPANWNQPALPAPIAPRPLAESDDHEAYIPFDWVGQTTRVVGIVVHRLLMKIAEDGLEHYAEPLSEWMPNQAPPPTPVVEARVEAKRTTRIASLWPAAEALLLQEGLAESERAIAIAQVRDAVTKTLEDSTGRWILSSHLHASSERAYTRYTSAGVTAVRIDRVFLSHDAHWIVDFKTTRAEGGGLEEFLAMQPERYRSQIESYQELVSTFSVFPVSSMLYFPLLRRFVRC